MCRQRNTKWENRLNFIKAIERLILRLNDITNWQSGDRDEECTSKYVFIVLLWKSCPDAPIRINEPACQCIGQNEHDIYTTFFYYYYHFEKKRCGMECRIELVQWSVSVTLQRKEKKRKQDEKWMKYLSSIFCNS